MAIPKHLISEQYDLRTSAYKKLTTFVKSQNSITDNDIRLIYQS